MTNNEYNQEMREINEQCIQPCVESYRVTIPGEIRKLYNIQKGDMIRFIITGLHKKNNNNGGNGQCVQP